MLLNVMILETRINVPSIREINEMLENCTYEEFLEIKQRIAFDKRKGVENLLTKAENKFVKLKKQLEEYNNRKIYELNLIQNNYKFIAGIDEVGRGPLAGSVYAAAVILNPVEDIIEIKDSKKLTHGQRVRIAEEIKEKAIDYSIGFATVEEIDRINILRATKLAMKRAVEGLKIKPEHLLIDALRLEELNFEQTAIVKGDDLSVSIGAASIIAKVERDRIMDIMAEKYPQYGFDKNKGYGTKEHIDAINKYGICDIHRKSFVHNFI